MKTLILTSTGAVALLLVACFTLMPSGLQAQYNLTTTYFNHNDLNAAHYTPANLHLGEKNVQFAGHFNFWVGNSAVDYGLINQIVTGGDLNQSEVDEYIGDLNDGVNILGMGMNFTPFSVAAQFAGKKKGRKFAISFTTVDHLGFTMVYPKELMELLWRGNKQFAGETVDFDPVSLNAAYYREYTLGLAAPIYGTPGETDFALRGGIRVKFLQGIASIYTMENDFSFTTEAEGRYIDLRTNYRLGSSGIVENNFQSLSPFSANGTGFGGDLGLTAFLGKSWEFSANLLDVGRINYDQNVQNYSNEGSYRYEGLAFGGLFGDDRLEQADTVLYIFEPGEDEDDYAMPLGAQILLQAEYKIQATSSKGESFARDAFFLSYIQGLDNQVGVTTRPFVSAGYDHNFNNVFDLGATVGFGGFNQFVFGSFANLSLGPLRFGIGSENLLPFVFQDLGTGIDLTTHASLTF